jgi:hypothetical protein
MNILALISGGRSSAMMAYVLQNSPKYKNDNIVFVFANTGMERPETIEFLKNMVLHWNLPLVKIEGVYSTKKGVGVSYVIKNFDNLNMSAKPFSEAIDHMNKNKFVGLPSTAAPYCTEYLKIRPMQKFAIDYFEKKKYVKAIGFRAEDMPKRISWAEIKIENKKIFPLITDFEAPITQTDLTNFFSDQPFQLNIHGKFGNCELCWKKSDKNIIDNIRHGTRFVEWYAQKEKEYRDTSFRGKRSIMELVKKAQQPFTPEINFNEDDFNCYCS